MLLAIAFFNSFMTGCVTFLEPTRKWVKLRSAALTIESEIWKYRTRMGDYSGGVGTLSAIGRAQAEADVQNRFSEFLNSIQETVKQGAGLSRSDLYANATTSPDTLGPGKEEDSSSRAFKSLIPAMPSTPSGRMFGSAVNRASHAFDKASGKLPPHLRDPDYIRHGQFHIGQQKLKPDDDNFHSPALPDDYIRFRLLPMRDFYQQRIPTVWRRYVFCQVFLLVASIASALIAATSEAAATAIVASLASGVKAWQEFTGIEQKLDRCSTVANALENTLLWWQGLPEEEKKVMENVSSLVMMTEGHVASETASWIRDGQAQLKRMQGSNQPHKSGNAGE